MWVYKVINLCYNAYNNKVIIIKKRSYYMLKKLIKCEYTNNYYYAINTINANEKAELQTIVNKYANIEGDYSTTLLQGVAHYKCDSGIMSDAYSVADAIYIDKNLSKYYGEEGDDTTDAFMEALNANVNKLQFLQCVRELYDFSVKYKFDDEAVCSLASDMEEQVMYS